MMRIATTLAALLFCSLLAACGGGGGGSTTVAASGGGGGGGGGSGGGNNTVLPAIPPADPALVPAQAGPNVLPVSVDPGLTGTANMLFTSVTVCAPGSTTQCQTIDHVQVDTGSTGLRLIASAVSPALGLTQSVAASGDAIVECMQFADGYGWGPVQVADVYLGGRVASPIPIQIIGDPTYPIVPAACSSVGPSENTVMEFGANGILGIGVQRYDCGSDCTIGADAGLYYTCPVAGCQPTTVPLAQQVANPVALLDADSNGTIIELPAVPPGGAATVTGSLVLGVGTQTNNDVTGAGVIAVDPVYGEFTTAVGARAYAHSMIDAGTSVTLYADSGVPTCNGPGAGFYCPTIATVRSAVVTDAHGQALSATFSIGNADALFTANPTFAAFAELAAPNPDAEGFVWGLPFFYGRRVITTIEGATTPLGAGPWFGYR